VRLSTLFWVIVLVASARSAAWAQSGEPEPHYCMGCNFAGSQLAGRDFSGDVLVGANFASAPRAIFKPRSWMARRFRACEWSRRTSADSMPW
jgi:uncharacterized protein YjbI with pentapeptide repeats